MNKPERNAAQISRICNSFQYQIQIEGNILIIFQLTFKYKNLASAQLSDESCAEKLHQAKDSEIYI